jgi:hypothetical protein
VRRIGVLPVRSSLILAALATLVAASGCGKREHAEESRQMQTQEVRGSTPPAPLESAPGPVVADTASVADIFSLIHEHESKLSQTITANQLDEVGREAFLIRDLTVAAARRANVAVDQKAALEQHVSTVRRLATELSEAGKAGDLTETQARNAELQKELGVIERMIGQNPGPNPGTK